MLPQPLNLSPSPLLVFQEKQHSSSLFGFGMLPPSPYGGMIVPPPVDSPSSISTKKTNHKKSVPPARKAKKSVRWGSAFSHTSKLRNPEDVSLMWYNSSDLEQFQQEKRKIIRALKHVKGDLAALEGTKYVTRGFECYQSVPFNRRIRKQRQAVVRQVLEHQSRQQQNQQQAAVMIEAADQNGMRTTTACSSETNSEALAEVARQESAWARGLAIQLGQNDAVEMGWKEFFAMDTIDSDSDSDENMNMEHTDVSQIFAQVPTIVEAANC